MDLLLSNNDFNIDINAYYIGPDNIKALLGLVWDKLQFRQLLMPSTEVNICFSYTDLYCLVCLEFIITGNILIMADLLT